MTKDRYRGIRRTITFPPDIFNKITELAQKDKRPYGQMVVKLLIDHLEEMEEMEEKGGS